MCGVALDNVGGIGYGNQINDITPLANLTNLTILKLGSANQHTVGNKITDLSPLTNLINLKELDLSCNKISDITPLAYLVNLTDLGQHRTKTALRALYASCLHLFRHLAQFVLARRQPCVVLIVQFDEKSDCAICAQSLCGIALDLWRNQVDNVEPLANLSNLKNLSIMYNDISETEEKWLRLQLPNCNITI